MTDEAHIARRCVELLERCDLTDALTFSFVGGGIVVKYAPDALNRLFLRSPKGLDALEAALLVLAQQSPPQPLATTEAGAQHATADASIPATDEELIAEMERMASEMDARGTVLTCDGRAGTYRECARMLRERKVKP